MKYMHFNKFDSFDSGYMYDCTGELAYAEFILFTLELENIKEATISVQTSDASFSGRMYLEIP